MIVMIWQTIRIRIQGFDGISDSFAQISFILISQVLGNARAGSAEAWSSPSLVLECMCSQEGESLSVCLVKAGLWLCPPGARAAGVSVWMSCKGSAEVADLLHVQRHGCAGPSGLERTGASHDRAQAAPASKGDAAWRRSPSPSPATLQLAPAARRHGFDRSTAGGRSEASGKGGRTPTNTSHCDSCNPRRRRSGSGARPEERAGQTAPSWPASRRARHPRSDSSWGPRREPAAAGWLSSRSGRSQQRPPRWHPEPLLPETPEMIPRFPHQLLQLERQHL